MLIETQANATKNTTENAHTTGQEATGKTQTSFAQITTPNAAKPQQDAGLIAGTLVETATGWRPVEMLRVGDHVQTYDGGLRQLRQIDRAYYGVADGAYPLQGILHVPAGALDNCDDVVVMPEQMLLIESQVAADLLGELSVLIPASALVGFRGITRHAPKGLIEAVTLNFEDEEVVYANSGLLVHCATKASGFFTELDHGRAAALLTLLGKRPEVLQQAIACLNITEPALLAAAA